MATLQSDSERMYHEWWHKNQFTKNGFLYKVGVNDNSAIWAMIPDDRKMTGKICFISSNLTLTNRDLDEEFHEGFTIGNGKTLYWMMIWHGSGHVTVVNAKATYKKWISGDTIITVRFKQQPVYLSNNRK